VEHRAELPRYSAGHLRAYYRRLNCRILSSEGGDDTRYQCFVYSPKVQLLSLISEQWYRTASAELSDTENRLVYNDCFRVRPVISVYSRVIFPIHSRTLSAQSHAAILGRAYLILQSSLLLSASLSYRKSGEIAFTFHIWLRNLSSLLVRLATRAALSPADCLRQEIGMSAL